MCILLVQQQMMETLHQILYLHLQPREAKRMLKDMRLKKITNTFKDVNKARDFQTVNAGVTTFEDW